MGETPGPGRRPYVRSQVANSTTKRQQAVGLQSGLRPQRHELSPRGETRPTRRRAGAAPQRKEEVWCGDCVRLRASVTM